jgi:hypothetical protein
MKMTEEEAKARLFAGIYPGGLVYADTGREKHGDYARLAFLSWATLQLDVEKDCPAKFREAIEADAAKVQARPGERHAGVFLGERLPLMKITNAKGRPFNVRFVYEGQRHGQTNAQWHYSTRPLVEFFDASPETVENFRKQGQGDLGQLVSQYRMHTLCEGRSEEHGLCLDGGVPEWSIDGPAMAPVMKFCRAWLAR